jgi:ferrochelatase
VTKPLSSKRVGVLVAQLGTPDAPTPKALYRYLKQFLSDRRVIDYPTLIWQPILQGIILQTRPRRSSELYARIWTEEGSPLLLYSQAQVAGIQERLGDDYRVILGMTYGNPSIAEAIKTLESEGINRIIVLPMFPQFSSTTTASIYDAVYLAAAGRTGTWWHDHKRNIPTLRFIEPYYEHPLYIEAMRRVLQAEIDKVGYMPDKFLISFHGIPNRYIRTNDPYRHQCERTAQLLAEAMNWEPDQWITCFQSRFGPEAWLEPYTEDVIESLHAQGIKRPMVFSPGFVTDCMETLDELGNEGREQFEAGGGHGDDFHLAPCLNDSDFWLDTMTTLVQDNAGGWVTSIFQDADTLTADEPELAWQLAGD